MKLAALLMAVLPIYATTLTGTISLPNGVGATGTIVFSLAQQAALQSGGCGGPAEIVPTAQVSFKVTAGAFTGTPTLYGNDCLIPQGTYYNVTFLDTNGNVLMTDRWQISGSSIDVGTIISVVIQGTTQTLGSTGVVLWNPTSNQTVNQPAGTATTINFFTVTGTLTFPSGASCTAAGCVGLFPDAVTLSTAQTVAGQKTFTSTLLFGPSTDVGSTTHPAQNGWFNTQVNTPKIHMYHGNPASPDGYFDMIMLTSGSFQILDNSGAQAEAYSPAAANAFGLPSWQFSGVMLAAPGTGGLVGGGWLGVGGFANGVFDSADLPCSIAPDGMQAIRNDVTPPQLQVCVSHTLYKISL